jgi:hypothetical protein
VKFAVLSLTHLPTPSPTDTKTPNQNLTQHHHKKPPQFQPTAHKTKNTMSLLASALTYVRAKTARRPDHSHEAAYQSGRLVPRRVAGYSAQGAVDATLEDFDTVDVEADVVQVDLADTPPPSPKHRPILRAPPEAFEKVPRNGRGGGGSGGGGSDGGDDDDEPGALEFGEADVRPLAGSELKEARNGVCTLTERAVRCWKEGDGTFRGFCRMVLNFCAKSRDDLEEELGDYEELLR